MIGIRKSSQKSSQILSNQEINDIQQPLNTDGYSNDRFTKLYGYNPHKGTERDRGNRKNMVVIGKPANWLIEKMIKEYKLANKKQKKAIKQWLNKWTSIDTNLS